MHEQQLEWVHPPRLVLGAQHDEVDERQEPRAGEDVAADRTRGGRVEHEKDEPEAQQVVLDREARAGGLDDAALRVCVLRDDGEHAEPDLEQEQNKEVAKEQLRRRGQERRVTIKDIVDRRHNHHTKDARDNAQQHRQRRVHLQEHERAALAGVERRIRRLVLLLLPVGLALFWCRLLRRSRRRRLTRQ